MKNNKGITLIALVITIIVMLILVGVTISMTVNGGLFDKAGEAVRDTNTKLQEEGELAEGGIEVNGEWYDSIDEYLIASGNKIETPELQGTWVFNDDIEWQEAFEFTVNFTTTGTEDSVQYWTGMSLTTPTSDYDFLYLPNTATASGGCAGRHLVGNNGESKSHQDY